MVQREISIKGMTCHHCVMSVEKELNKLSITDLTVKIGSARFQYDELKVSEKDIHSAIEEAGYEVVN